MTRTYDDDDHKVSNPGVLWLKLSACVLILPIMGLLASMDAFSAVVGALAGIATLALLLQRPQRNRAFPYKIVLAAISCQSVAMLLMSNIIGTGPFLLSEIQSSSEIHAFKLDTRFSERVDTMSVILPCANEGVFAVKTARSIGERTPRDVLKEIIIVDDGSTPPLEDFFKENGPDVLEKYPIRFIRHETFTGLINAKKQGGDRAEGDVLTFLDCHVLPRDYGPDKSWADGIMSRIAGNYKRIVVPSITDLDADRWDEIGRPNGIAKCYLSLDVDFRWFDSEDDFVPIMSGGLLAMSRRWWQETGGYDTGMIGWGGENIDQSLRAWLCGGEIVQATDSHVAHMWRTNDKPETKAKYTVPEGAVNSNRYRAALAWFDDYIEKVHEYPIFSKFVPPTSAPLPNIDSILEVKHRLQCKPLQWFIDRFSKVYLDAAVLPDQVFRIRDESTNLCLARRNSGQRDTHHVVAASCSTDDPMQLWHKANRDGDICCSGLRSYNSMYCLSGGAQASASECNTFGRNTAQHVEVTREGELRFTKANSCASLAASPKDVVVQTPCDQEGFLREFTVKAAETSDGFGRGLYKIVEATTGNCLTAFSPVGGDDDAGSIEAAPCEGHSNAQLFNLTESYVPGLVQIRTWENLCLDAAEGKRILAYVCYDNSVENAKQVFSIDEATRTIRNKYHPTCIAVPDSRMDMTAKFSPVSISGCVTWNNVVKAEQMFEKQSSLRGLADYFLIKSGRWCLSSQEGKDDVVVVPCPHSASDENDSMLWSFGSLARLKNRSTDKCLDGNDHKRPILYPCYSNENDNQEWSDPGNGGVLKNSRAQMCLDYLPTVERKVSVSGYCRTGSKWSIFDPRESTEMVIYRRTKAKLSAPIHG